MSNPRYKPDAPLPDCLMRLRRGWSRPLAVKQRGYRTAYNCGEHDWEVVCAYERAAAVMAEAARKLPRSEVEERVRALIAEDAYGVRLQLASVVPEEHM
jgi:hypothetical protein